MEGWISLHRKILEKGWYKKPDHFRLWMHLLLKAYHKDKEIWFNGKNTIIKRGQFITGRKKLAIEIGISESKIERILNYFEKSEQQIEQQKTNKNRMITVLNYDEYQRNGSGVLSGESKPNEQPSEQQANNKRTTSEQQVNTYNNNNNDNNVNNDNKYIPPNFDNEFLNIVYEFYEFQETQHKNQLNGWRTNQKLIEDSCDVIEKLHRLDNFALNDIKCVLRNATKDDFWSKQIISIRGLRNKSKNGQTKFQNAAVKLLQKDEWDEMIKNAEVKENYVHS